MEKNVPYVTRKIAGKTYLISLAAGPEGLVLFELNETASFLWDLLREGKNQAELEARLESEFEFVTRQEAISAVDEFLGSMSVFKANPPLPEPFA